MRCVALKHVVTIILLTTIISCRKPYNPPAITSPGSYLVVEGVINAGSDSTIIKLSRTVNLSSGTTVNPETGAIIIIQSSNNISYTLLEISTGSYSVQALNLDVTQRYRLSIKTANNQQYLSDFVSVNLTPPIDSVGFTIQANGIQLYVNTHDPNNNTKYYRWDYQETWQFHAKYYSAFVSNGTAIVGRSNDQQIYSCFGNEASSSIILGTSAKLSQDVIYQQPITTVLSTSEKIESKYSILVKEYALTETAYNFYLNIKKNTEQLGSIFDAEPSEIKGNIRNINNTSEPVIGYVTASTVQSKRIFISYSQLPSSFITIYPYNCIQDTDYFSHPKSFQNDVANNLIPLPNPNIPTSTFYLPGNINPAGYLASDQYCVDCTLRGTTIQPSFWK